MARVHLLLLLTTAGCYYECGGGMSDQSVTVPGEDGVVVKAKLERPRAVLELERKTRRVHGQGEVRYLFDKTLVEQELRLVVGDGGKLATFVVAKHDRASTFPEYRLQGSPDGQRVAYRLGDEPWRIVHVLSSTLAVHQKEPVEGELDWARAPTFTEAFVALYDANEMQLDGLYSFHKLGPMWSHLDRVAGDEVTAEMLVRILDVAFAGWRPEERAMITPAVREQLVQKLRARVETSGTAAQYRALVQLSAIDPSRDRELVRAAVTVLADDDATLLGEAAELTQLIGSQDRSEARAVACRLRSRIESPAPYALVEGRPLRALVDELAVGCE